MEYYNLVVLNSHLKGILIYIMSRKSSVKHYNMFEARLFWVTDDFFIEILNVIFFLTLTLIFKHIFCCCAFNKCPLQYWKTLNYYFIRTHCWGVQWMTLNDWLLPECTPMRIHMGIPGRCCNWNVPMKDRMSSAMQQMSFACLFPLRLGRPDTTMYASPIVSTWKR